jgi:hypothetical protein
MAKCHGDVIARPKAMKLCKPLFSAEYRRYSYCRVEHWLLLEFPRSDRSQLDKFMIARGQGTGYLVDTRASKKLFDELSQLRMGSGWNV